MVLSSNCAVPKSHVIVLMSLLVIQLFFFFANDGSIVTLGSTNIIFDHNFLTFCCTLVFFLTLTFSHCVVPIATHCDSYLVSPG